MAQALGKWSVVFAPPRLLLTVIVPLFERLALPIDNIAPETTLILAPDWFTTEPYNPFDTPVVARTRPAFVRVPNVSELLLRSRTALAFVSETAPTVKLASRVTVAGELSVAVSPASSGGPPSGDQLPGTDHKPFPVFHVKPVSMKLAETVEIPTSPDTTSNESSLFRLIVIISRNIQLSLRVEDFDQRALIRKRNLVARLHVGGNAMEFMIQAGP